MSPLQVHGVNTSIESFRASATEVAVKQLFQRFPIIFLNLVLKIVVGVKGN